MDATEQAIDQTMRLTLSGAEHVLKLSGTGAARLAAALMSVATTQQKSSGKARLASLLKSGKELKVFNVTEGELATFAREAKRYGVLYAVVKGTGASPDDLVDIMVKSEDAAKINRIVERLEYRRFDESDVVVEARRDLARRGGGKGDVDRGEKAKDTNELLGELLGTKAKGDAGQTNPTAAMAAAPSPSKPLSDKDGHRQDGSTADGKLPAKDAPDSPAKGTSKTREGRGFEDGRKRHSVKAEIAKKKDERTRQGQGQGQQTKPSQTRHQNQGPAKRRGTKPKPEKGR